MSYEAIFSKIFIKSVKRVDEEMKERVKKIVKEILKNPYSGVPLTHPLKGYWRKRIGKYRIIYKIDEKDKEVLFIDFGLRKKIYRK